MSKVTIKDIAKAAGVSIATVSYVINNKPTEKISDETRKKVLQWVNIFGYVPNASAIAMKTSKTNNIAFISSPNLTYLQKLDLMIFLELFSSFVLKKGYRVLYTYQTKQETIRNVDAIVCYNMPKSQFYALGSENNVPLIAVDLLLNDTLFYQVTKNYETIFNQANDFFNDSFTLITLRPQDIETENEIKKVFKNIIFVSMLEDLVSTIKENHEKNIVLYDYFIKNIFDALYPNNKVYYISLRENERYQKILESIEFAINRDQDKEHYIKI